MSEPGIEESPQLSAFRAGHGEFAKAFNEGDFERAFAPLPDDCEIVLVPGILQERIVGRDAIINWFVEFRRDVTDWRLEPTEYIEVGPLTFLVGYEGRGMGRTSGLPAEQHLWDVYDLDHEGQVRRVRQFSSREEAEAAAAERESAA